MKCCCCNKSVNVMGFDCKCGNRYCSTHRLPEEHKCTFNHKEEGLNNLKTKLISEKTVPEKIIKI